VGILAVRTHGARISYRRIDALRRAMVISEEVYYISFLIFRQAKNLRG